VITTSVFRIKPIQKVEKSFANTPILHTVPFVINSRRAEDLGAKLTNVVEKSGKK